MVSFSVQGTPLCVGKSKAKSKAKPDKNKNGTGSIRSPSAEIGRIFRDLGLEIERPLYSQVLDSIVHTDTRILSRSA